MPKSPNPYTMIVFDAGGTLIGADWPRVTQDLATVARDHRLDVDGISVMTGLRQVWQDFIDGRVEDRANSRTAVTAFWNEMLARTLSLAADLSLPTDGESYDPRAWDAACAFYPAFDAGAYHRLIDGAEESLFALQAAGYRLAMLSNWSPRLPRVLQRLDIRHYFEFVIVSALVGVAKPDRAIFDLAVRISGCRPEELLYVGDSPAADIIGSRAAGWDAILIANRHPDADVPLKVRSLAELPVFLAALAGGASEK